MENTGELEAAQKKIEELQAAQKKFEELQAAQTKFEELQAAQTKFEEGKTNSKKKEKKLKAPLSLPPVKIKNPTVIYSSIDLKALDSHKKIVASHLEILITENINIIRPTNDKAATIDAHSKNQLLYILHRFIHINNIVKDDVQPERINKQWLTAQLRTDSTDFMLHDYLHGITDGMDYNMLGEQIEEDILQIISQYLENEELAQYCVELFICVMKRWAFAMSAMSHTSTKRVSSDRFHELLRAIDRHNINPKLFDEIYGFVNFRKTHKKK
jgi:hypothetical protein